MTKNTGKIRKNRIIGILLFALFLSAAAWLSACSLPEAFTAGNASRGVEKSTLLLDTVVTVKLFDTDRETANELINRCFAECARYEKIFSRTDEQSELYALNARGALRVSDDLLAVLDLALEYCSLSDGAFDVTLGAVSDLYAFSSDAPRVPSEEELGEALRHCGWEKIRIDGHDVILTDPAARIDLGAIAKGYIADRLADFLRENGVRSAIVSLGGNVICIGGKGEDVFRVGIKDPTDERGTVAVVGARDVSVVTSGVYERSFERDGVLYHHLLDPKTGLPVRNSLLSVTVVNESSVDCDAFSTLLFALGLEEGLRFANEVNLDAVFVTDDLETHYTDGFERLLLS